MSVNNMRILREEKGMSMSELSFASRVSERYLYFIERGEKNPSLKTAHAIANALDAKIEDIFFETN